MNIQAAVQVPVENRATMSAGAEALERDRKLVTGEKAAEQSAAAEKENKAQPEELLQNIKALTDNGLYSVRFEMNKDTQELIINLVDRESGDIIRQIPPKEILGMHKTLSELRGNFVETQS